MKKEGAIRIFNSQDGKLNSRLFFLVLISAIVVFVAYSILVSGVVPQEFPANNTNASLTKGFAYGGYSTNISRFNATNPQFKCNVTSLNATTYNVTRVVLFINRTDAFLDNNSATINQSTHLNHSVAENAQEIVIFNVSTAFDQGIHAWMCQQEDNATTKTINQSGTSFFTIDTSAPAIAKINISSNTSVFNTTSSSTKLSTGDFVRIAANFTDTFTTIDTVRLFVNYSGVANNEVNITGGTSGVEAGNGTIVNLTTVIPGNASIAMGSVLNFTLQVNDSVGNVNITQALIFTVEGDGTPPGPINLTYPINLFNQTSTSIIFNFTAFDNNDTNFNCGINVSLGGSIFANISRLNVTSGVAHVNDSSQFFSLSNGTYTWNVSCSDGPGNLNTSLSSTFTVDQIPPVFDYYNFTNNATFNASKGEANINVYQLGTNSNNNSRAQSNPSAAGFGNTFNNTGRIFVIANFTDNLTYVSQGAMQFFNVTSPSWQTVNSSDSTFKASQNTSNWINFTYQIPAGHNEFEGRNVSFRLIANDTLGNINTTTVKNFTILINDTTAPTITINGTIAVNNSNLTITTVPVVSWAVVEGNALLEINVSVDGAVNNDDGCNKFKRFTTAVGPNNVESNRNNSFATSSDAACTLGNGTHFIAVTARDTWNNLELVNHSFTVSAGTAPVLMLNLTNLGRTAQHSKNETGAAGNTSNITSFVGIQLFGVSGGPGSSIDKIKYVSSCNSSSSVVVNNNTVVYPFNESGCNTASANRTLTITINDTAGNSVTNVTTFLVDNVGPTLTIHSPTNGQSFANTNALFNVSALDNDQALSFFGYYLDDNNLLYALNGSTGGVGGAGIISAAINTTGLNTTAANLTNLTGTHKVKFTINDSLGNLVNSSFVTFTMISIINVLDVNQSIFANNQNSSNISLFLQNGTLLSGSFEINQTLELFAIMNESNANKINLTVTINFNGSAANWNATNEIVFRVNDSGIRDHTRNNQSSIVNRSLFINSSFSKFLNNNNSYFGKVRFEGLNISNLSAAGTLGGRHNLWFFPDHNDMSAKTNITQCSAGFSPTHQMALSAGTFPCWNNSANGGDIYVPHFSVVVFAENSEAPTVNVTTPDATGQVGTVFNSSTSMFVPNITVSPDASLCEYSINGTETKHVMTKSGNVCLGQTERFKELTSATATYNFTFNVTDTGNNVNTYIFRFNITDDTSPNSGIITSSPSTTSATVTATGVNETVNATVIYGTVNTTLSSTAMETDFNTTQAVSITGLTASTTYFYNITVCDFNGNCKGNGTFSFATSAAAAAAAAAASTSSSGASGSGGGAAVSNTAASAGKVWDTIAAGSTASLTVNSAQIAVTGVAIEVANTVSNAQVNVESLVANPLSTPASTKVYQYLQITRSNIADADTSKITISFKVPKTWHTANGVAETNVVLYRYSDGVWNPLPTTMIGSDANNVLYEAITPGFSTFAVGSTETGPAPPPGVEVCTDITDNDGDGLVDLADPDCQVPVSVPEICDDGLDNDLDGTIDAADTDCQVAPPPAPVEEKKGLSGAAIAWILVAIIAVIAIIGFVMMKRKQQQ